MIQPFMCPCGRGLPVLSWCCQICYLEKEIRYALSELSREGDAWEGKTWREFGVQRLEGLVSS